ncbi:MAG: rhomboid family protein [Verrucomicrobiales bacterium]|nr:rhomboid family protein [Verrucomicrobiales bacterium]
MAELPGDTSCSIHADRRSTARCPSCRQFYCAECITEHDGRMTCASCLSAASKPVIEPRKRTRFPMAAIAQMVMAVVVAWLLFYFFAQTLADIPDEFHDGTIWE